MRGQFRLAKCISQLIHLAVIQENVFAHGEALQVRSLLLKFARKFFGYRNTFLGIANRGLQDLRKFHRAVGFQCKRKTGDGTRYRDRPVADY